MNKERLVELQKQAQEATEVAATLEKLGDADPYRSGVQCSLKEWNTGTALLDDSLLKKVIATGRLAVIAELEAKLGVLLGVGSVGVAKDVVANRCTCGWSDEPSPAHDDQCPFKTEPACNSAPG